MAEDVLRLSGLGTKLRHILELLDGDLERIYEEDGLGYRPRYTPIMRALLKKDVLTIRQIAESAGITHSAASQTVSRMKVDGFVVSEPGQDARERVIRLSAKGRASLPQIRDRWRATTAAANTLNTELSASLDDVLDEAITALRERSFRERITDEMTVKTP